MHAFESIAEQRISEAVARGEFDHLPGQGQPLNLDEDLLVPQDLRMAYRILKNAGYVPPEVHTLNEIGALERLVQSLDHGAERDRALRKLRLLSMQLGELRGGSLQLESDYYDRLVQRLADKAGA
ncbi:MAG TPA: DnaJ family domain-containing protein [Methylophilaceae bacterium]|nr:DnaJ family domain-containing protein [Methylophilaceae bacterium]